MNNTVIYPNQKPIFIASGSSLSEAAEPSTSGNLPEGVCHSDSIEINKASDNINDNILKNKMQELERNIKEIDKSNHELNPRIENLCDKFKNQIKKSKINKDFFMKVFCGFFIPSTLGLIFGAPIVELLGATSLKPTVLKSFISLIIGEAALMGCAEYIQNRYDKSVLEPVINEYRELKKEETNLENRKKELEKEKKSINEAKDMIFCAENQSNDPVIKDNDEFIEIGGLKVTKHKFDLVIRFIP